MAIKKGKREVIDTGTTKRYTKRDTDGTFSESVDVGRSLAADQRSKSKTTVKPGYGDQGDQAKLATKKGATKKAATKKAAAKKTSRKPAKKR
jgi:hypothetical protein